MRIITGKLKGRQIPTPKTGQLRPTSDRTKEAIFSSISTYKYIDNLTVLDLFAGSGNLGFEAISRGASYVQFVDQVSDHIRHIDDVAKQFGVSTQTRTAAISVEDYLNRTPESFDLIFADPPYDYFAMNNMIEIILNTGWLKTDGWFILEHDKYHKFSDHPHCRSSRAYGRTTVSIFEAQPVDSE